MRLVLASLVLWPALAAAAAPEKAPADAIAVRVARAAPDAPVCPGEPVALRLTLENRTGKPLMIPDWEFFAEMIDIRVRITGYPGASGADEPEKPRPPWEGRPFQARDFRELPPGETVVMRSVTPMLPGKACVTVTVYGPSAEYRALTDGRPQRVKNGWTGRAEAGLALEVPAAESAAMKDRYAECRERLRDPLVPAEQKGRLLVQVAGEKHYFAARFLREAHDALPAGPMRDAAIGGLLALAKLGTGHEAAPLLLKSMGDPNVAQPQRELILAWAEESLAQKGRLPVADQAWYTWPDEHLKAARAAIEQLTGDRNPYLAARAKEALRRLEKAARP